MRGRNLRYALAAMGVAGVVALIVLGVSRPASTGPATATTPTAAASATATATATPSATATLLPIVLPTPVPVGTPATPATSTTTLPANPPTCTATTLGGSRTANAALAADCDTLLAIKSTLAGTATLNWSATLALDQWKGVSRWNSTRVRALDLRKSGLTGVIPTQLGNLTDLRRLILLENRLTGAIPTQLGNLEKLQVLCFDRNRLSGSIPTQIGKLTALTILCMQNNRLAGAMPTQLGDLSRLERLRLDGNALTGNVPHELGRLTALTHVHLAGNSLTGCIPWQLRRVANSDLASLRLSYCPVPVLLTLGQTVGAGTYRIVGADEPGVVFTVPAGNRITFSMIQIVLCLGWCGGDAIILENSANDKEWLCILSLSLEECGRNVLPSGGSGSISGQQGDSASGGSGAMFDAIIDSARPGP